MTPTVVFVHVKRTNVNKKIAQANELCMSLWYVQFNLFVFFVSVQSVKPRISYTLNVYTPISP
jgi:hypothetical protein